MCRSLLIYPVLFFPSHSLPTGNLSGSAWPVEGARLGAIAEVLLAAALLLRFPLINDHLNRHQAALNVAGAPRLVGPAVKATMAPLKLPKLYAGN